MNLEELIKIQELEKNKRKLSKITTSQTINKKLTKLWNLNSGDQWDIALKGYWELLKPDTVHLEEVMANLNPDEVKAMTAEEFYNFLHYVYFEWKYTAKNRLATTRKSLQRYKTENRLDELDKIKKDIFTFDLEDTKKGLEIVSRIHGLGIAGASGLLALLFPKKIGTVDQFVVKNLRSI